MFDELLERGALRQAIVVPHVESYEHRWLESEVEQASVDGAIEMRTEDLVEVGLEVVSCYWTVRTTFIT